MFGTQNRAFDHELKGDHRRCRRCGHLPGMVAAKTTLPVLRRARCSRAPCRGGTRCSPSCRCQGDTGRNLRDREAGAANAALFAVALLANGRGTSPES